MATRKRGLWTYIKTILFLIVLITILVNIWFVLNELLKANDSSNNYSYDHLGNRHQFNDNDHEDQSNQAQSTMVVEVNG